VHGGGQPRAERRAHAAVPRRGRAALRARVPHRGGLRRVSVDPGRRGGGGRARSCARVAPSRGAAVGGFGPVGGGGAGLLHRLAVQASALRPARLSRAGPARGARLARRGPAAARADRGAPRPLHARRRGLRMGRGRGWTRLHRGGVRRLRRVLAEGGRAGTGLALSGLVVAAAAGGVGGRGAARGRGGPRGRGGARLGAPGRLGGGRGDGPAGAGGGARARGDLDRARGDRDGRGDPGPARARRPARARGSDRERGRGGVLLGAPAGPPRRGPQRARHRRHLRGRGGDLLDRPALRRSLGLGAAPLPAHHARARAEHRELAAAAERPAPLRPQRPLALRPRPRRGTGLPLMLFDLIIKFSYPGVFLVLLATGLGLPIPEELPIVIAAMMSRWEVMHWWGALLSCLGGVLAGDMLLYVVGRHFGRRILEWPAARRILTPEREARVMEAYHRHGLKFVIMARLVMGLRAAAFLTAGLVRVPFPRFLLVD